MSRRTLEQQGRDAVRWLWVATAFSAGSVAVPWFVGLFR